MKTKQLRPEQPDTVDVRLTKPEAAALAAMSGSVGGDPRGPRNDAQRALQFIGRAFGFAGYEEARAWLQVAEPNREFSVYGSITLDAKYREERRTGTDRRKAKR